MDEDDNDDSASLKDDIDELELFSDSVIDSFCYVCRYWYMCYVYSHNRLTTPTALINYHHKRPLTHVSAHPCKFKDER